MKKFLLIFCILVIPFALFASSGGTDIYGGHVNSSTNQYEYHHGNKAHNHIGGCEYNYYNPKKGTYNYSNNPNVYGTTKLPKTSSYSSTYKAPKISSYSNTYKMQKTSSYSNTYKMPKTSSYSNTYKMPKTSTYKMPKMSSSYKPYKSTYKPMKIK